MIKTKTNINPKKTSGLNFPALLNKKKKKKETSTPDEIIPPLPTAIMHVAKQSILIMKGSFLPASFQITVNTKTKTNTKTEM